MSNVFSLVPSVESDPGTIRAYDHSGKLVFSQSYGSS